MKKYLLLLLIKLVAFLAPAQELQQKINELLNAYAKENKFNGTALVARQGSIILEKGYGYRNVEEKIPHDPSDIFQIGSITKQITAAVVMQLQEEGKLSVQNKLNKFFPEIKNADKITIEHLLTHTSGIYNYTNDMNIMKSDITISRNQKEMVELIRNYPSDFEPGTKWNYSNSAYSLLGYIIEKVTNKPYEQVVRERIFQPLGMLHSGFDFTHLTNAKKSKGYFSFSAGKALPSPIVDSTIAYSAGAVYSTVEDLYKWEQAIYTDKLLKQQAWRAVFTPYKNKYGYGWNIDTLFGKTFTSHSGGIPGFTSYLLRFPEDQVAVILLDNTSSSQLSKIARSVAAIIYDKPYELPKIRKEIKLDKAVLKQYEGEYQLAPNFIITIRLDGERLKAQATNQPEFELYAENENFFFLKAVDAQFEFTKDASGNVTELVLYQNGMQPKGKKIK